MSAKMCSVSDKSPKHSSEKSCTEIKLIWIIPSIYLTLFWRHRTLDLQVDKRNSPKRDKWISWWIATNQPKWDSENTCDDYKGSIIIRQSKALFALSMYSLRNYHQLSFTSRNSFTRIRNNRGNLSHDITTKGNGDKRRENNDKETKK